MANQDPEEVRVRTWYQSTSVPNSVWLSIWYPAHEPEERVFQLFWEQMHNPHTWHLIVEAMEVSGVVDYSLVRVYDIVFRIPPRGMDDLQLSEPRHMALKAFYKAYDENRIH